MKLFLSSICIVLAFFAGYSFSEEKQKQLLQSYEEASYFVNLQIKKNKLTIDKNSENIEVLINGETLNGEITLENVCY